MAVRVLIVDDSGFFRRRLSEIISSDPKLQVVGTAENGQQAIEQAALLKPDVITMDIEMPVMDGITAVRRIMAKQPTPILMLSTWSTEGAKSTLDALDAGAVDYMPKRFKDISGDQHIAQKKICQRLIHLATSFHGSNTAQLVNTTPTNVITTSRSADNKAIKLIAIGTSTGGPVALQKVLSQLPASFPHPILLIQHMPASFTPSFAERLNAQCAIKVKQAQDGDRIEAGTAYLAPGGAQMLLKGSKSHPHISIQTGEPDQTYRPCIDITLNSISQFCSAETLAIILTGMGADGREGCRVLKQSGATIWAQDEKSSTIYGMPMAIAKAQLADRILSLADIGKQLAELN
ncbi:MAG: chemotaxis response regulator protein-glutamate methylesterase [Gammaproteobacteria bacterium]|nr:chemotaxis response regulator protein-glutamate methylesterase [Gammaproteobacteria bacterium]